MKSLCIFALAMKFKTEVSAGKDGFDLNHRDHILTMGSCFSDNFGAILHRNKFDVLQNPFGVLYNPVSVIKDLERLWYGNGYKEEDLFEYNGLYGSFAHHTSFSGPDKRKVLEHISATFETASRFLREKATCLVITFGTSWVYSFSESGRIVANCHKIPDCFFSRRRLDIGEVVDYYTAFFYILFETVPEIKVLMTVSPIRHFKDGAHENTLSKSVLHLTIDELMLRFPQIHYFPAYEIIQDELRDYRFYAEDMLHPSGGALRYLWEKFCGYAFEQSVMEVLHQLDQIHKAMEHKPFRPHDEAYRHFAEKNIAMIEMLRTSYPDMDLKEESDFFNKILK